MGCARFAASALLLLGCAPQPIKEPLPRVDVASLIYWKACFDSPTTQDYWDHVERRIYEEWQFPPDAPANQEVRLRFAIDAEGRVLSVETVDASNNLVEESAITAVRSAEPFGLVPPGAECLIEAPIVGDFRNPLAEETSSEHEPAD
jgi:TonB family protein